VVGWYERGRRARWGGTSGGWLRRRDEWPSPRTIAAWDGWGVEGIRGAGDAYRDGGMISRPAAPPRQGGGDCGERAAAVGEWGLVFGGEGKGLPLRTCVWAGGLVANTKQAAGLRPVKFAG
jgi:hypothetical protein